MTDLSPKARALQEKLLQRYIDSIPGKQAEIARVWYAVKAEDFDEELLAQLRTLAHRLAGSAGSYGLDEMGLAALALEQAIRRSVGEPLRRDGIEVRVDELLTLLENAQKKA